MSKYEWELNPSKTSWYYTDRNGYIWGSAAIISKTAYGVFVRYEFREPLKWVTHIDNLEEAQNLVQTLVGASNV